MPQISVIVPTYNSASYLPETLASILAQDFGDLEVIVVDDHSADDTADVVASFDDPRIRYIALAVNHGGPSRPRNVGIKEARGEYISFFDSDDIMLQGKIAFSLDLLNENREVAMVFTDAVRITDAGTAYPGTLLNDYTGLRGMLNKEVGRYQFVICPDAAYPGLFEENYIPTSGVTVRRDVLLAAKLFDESLTNGDDLDMWFRITRRHAVGFIDRPLHKYRVRCGSVSKRGVETVRNRIRVLQKQLNGALPSELENKAKRLLASNYYGLGYSFREQGEMLQARDNYVESLRHRFSWYTLRGYLTTFLGSRIFRWLRPL